MIDSDLAAPSRRGLKPTAGISWCMSPMWPAGRILPLLEQNGQAAVTFARPVDDRACQIKGPFVEARPAGDDERAVVEVQWHGLLAQLRRIGIPRETVAAWSTWPVTAIRLKVNAIFDQTPGTAAGTVIA